MCRKRREVPSSPSIDRLHAHTFIQPTANTFINPLLPLLPSSPPALLRRVLLLGPVTQTLAQTHTARGQSAPCTTITFPSTPASQHKQHTLPRNPLGSPGWSSQSRLHSAPWTFLVLPRGSQTEPAQGWSDPPR